jgi:methionyl-tRNA formyltransferase
VVEVPPPPWRIVLLTMVLQGAEVLTLAAKRFGHEPVALLTPRPRAELAAQQRFRELIEGAPPELDVAIVPSKERLPRLLRAYEPDLCMCLGYPWLLPREVIEIPKLGIVNAHPSLLPKYRGPIPFAWAMRNGDTELGQTFHLMDERFDTGPILAQGSVPLAEHEYFEDAIPRMRELVPLLLEEAFAKLARGERGDPQTEEGATWAGFFEDEYAYVDWSKPRREIHNQVRAWRVAFGSEARGAIAELDGERVRILRASLEPVEGAREVQAGDGPLWVVETEPVTG